jgi:N-methylhydantoinase B
MITLDTTTLVVMANRLDSITREMTNTVVRTARSTTMAAKDFSCSVMSADHQMLSSPEGLPVHVFGMGPSAAAMAELQPDFAEGDAFLHNDPYRGNSHAADHQILVPVFVDGEHVFTACVKAHQVDCGNALPTTYMPMAKDVYEEGALVFPCVRIQKDYADVPDIVRMCELRIRAYETWYGDYLAQLGAARLAERRLKAFCAKFGVERVKQFVEEWLDYSERITAEAIRSLPAGRVVGETSLDPFPGAPEGIPLKAIIDIDPEVGEVLVDLRDNPDCVPNGLNLTWTTATNSGITGVLCVLNSRSGDDRVMVPNNSGSFRRIKVRLRENCVVGIPRHPTSCSVSTNTVADRMFSAVFTAFTQLPGDVGLAEPCFGSPPFMAVVSGRDPRRDDFYIMQIISGTAGGPASAEVDGWLMLTLPNAAGMAYMDSVEVVEQKTPLVLWDRSLRPDSEGAGRRRGAPGNHCIYGPRLDTLDSHYFLDGVLNPPRGVRGGGDASGPEAWVIGPDGAWTQQKDVIGAIHAAPHESIVSVSAGGGGFGDPLAREPELVLTDAMDEWITLERAESVYGVVVTGDRRRFETWAVDVEATAARRAELAAQGCPDGYRCEPHQPSWWTGAAIAGV